MLISIETHITCDWGVTPSGSAHGAESPSPCQNAWIFAWGVQQMTGELAISHNIRPEANFFFFFQTDCKQ